MSESLDALLATTQLEREKADGIRSLIAASKLAAGYQHRAEKAEADNARLRTVLTEVLATFWIKTHPGMPCRRSDHIALHVIDRWREALS